jgi:amino acid transporter
MKPKLMKIIKYDHYSKFLFIIAFVATLLFIAIIAAEEVSVMGIIIPVLVVVIILLVLRVLSVSKNLQKYKDNKVVGKVEGVFRNNGMFYMSFSYEVNGKLYSKRFTLLVGPIQKGKLSKIEQMTLVYDKENPKKAFIEDLMY